MKKLKKGVKTKVTIVTAVFLMLALLFLSVCLLYTVYENKELKAELQKTTSIINTQKQIINYHQKQQEEPNVDKQKYNEILRKLNFITDFIDEFEIKEMEITAYAPLDPKAVEGVCYKGNPAITASGERVEPGVTVAASTALPFGTKVYVEGVGWRKVQDRGGMIGEGNLDLAVNTQEEAKKFGRQKKKVIIIREGKN